MFKHIFNIIWLIAFTPVISLAGKIDTEKLNKANWINIETANFNVLTDSMQEKAIALMTGNGNENEGTLDTYKKRLDFYKNGVAWRE